MLRSLMLLKPGEYLRSWTQYDQNRGMNRWRDVIDWVGGYPYEVAKPEEIYLAVKFIIECDYFTGRCIDIDGGMRL